MASSTQPGQTFHQLCCALSGSRCDPEEQGHLRDDRLGMDGISGEP